MSNQPDISSADEPILGEFAKFNFRPEILKGLTEAGFKLPSPVQEKAIPLVMSGCDLIAQAQTGTGKTAAFGLPLLNNLKKSGQVEVLVITPTRELASQVSDEIFRLGKFDDVKTVAVYGGQSISRQVELVRRGASILVATPGRLLDQLESKRFKKFAPSVVVLDEADEMLDMGFLEDIEKIFALLPQERQTLLFSATMPPAIQKLSQNILTKPVHIKTATGMVTGSDISQQFCLIREHERSVAIIRLIESEDPDKSIIFCRTKKETDTLCSSLVAIGYQARALHGDMVQKQREEAIRAFKREQAGILVATDVASRGLDVTGITHVFNYHMPFDVESYIHRIGRTGRAGMKGIAITLLTPLEYKTLNRIQQVTGATIKMVEIPSASDMVKIQDEKLFETIIEQPVQPGAGKLLKRLEAQIGLEAATEKLISIVMSGSDISGPEQIGLSSGEFEKLKEKKSSSKKERGFSKRGGRSARPSGRSKSAPEKSGPWKPGPKKSGPKKSAPKKAHSKRKSK